jgi:hypothetical protein
VQKKIVPWIISKKKFNHVLHELNFRKFCFLHKKNVYSAHCPWYRIGLTHEIEVPSPHSKAVLTNSYHSSSCTIKGWYIPYKLQEAYIAMFHRLKPLFIELHILFRTIKMTLTILTLIVLFKNFIIIYDAKTNLML